MKEDFNKFKEWLKSNYEAGLNDLNPPATDLELEELSTTLGYTLPKDLVTLLQLHNGQKGNVSWLFEGQEFLSSHRIIDEWKVWQELLDDGGFDDCLSEPQEGIKNSWWNKKWIPFTYNGCGDHFCIDLDPAERGISGQVITMWHDMAGRELLSFSLESWFNLYIKKLLAGEYIYSDEYGSIINKSDA